MNKKAGRALTIVPEGTIKAGFTPAEFHHTTAVKSSINYLNRGTEKREHHQMKKSEQYCIICYNADKFYHTS